MEVGYVSKDDARETEEARLREEIRIFEDEFLQSYERRVEDQKRQIDLVKGVSLGLLYGIIGNFAVQHWFPVFEGLMLKNYDIWFYGNAIIFLVALCIIIYTSLWFRNELKWQKTKLDIASDWERVTRIQIQDMKKRLDELKRQ